MGRAEPDPETRRLGDALAALRRDAGLSQAEAGARLGMTSQGWGLYEAGRRPGLFRPDVQRRLTLALDRSPEDLALKLVQAGDHLRPPVLSATGLASPGRAFADAPAIRRRLTLTDDDLSPWAASGVVVEFEEGRWPRQGQGCVIDMADGSRRVRLYHGADDATVVVLKGAPPAGEEERLPRGHIRRLSAVVARLDP